VGASVSGRHRAPLWLLPCELLGRGLENVEHPRHWRVLYDEQGRGVEVWCFGYYGPHYWAARERAQQGRSWWWERRRRRELTRRDPRRRVR
jgi:hypothetical protein